MKYQFHPAAAEEHLETVAYYESKLVGLGASYLLEFEQMVNKACESSSLYPIVIEPDIRQMQMKRFPFTVFFRDIDDFVVFAVAHQRRRPNYWLGRIN